MIRQLHEKLKTGEITSQKITEEYFDRIEKKDENINAYLTLTKELALKQARAVDDKIKNGQEISLIEGIPGAIKDNICIEGIRTTAASKILDNYIAPYDATVISKLKQSGAVILGKTNMDEFGHGASTEKSAYGPTKNPHDLERVPGGSSGGSAASVVADMSVWALGTDTGGSIRQPAALCGAVGLKPTYGRVSRYGAIAMGSSLDQIGPITKTVEDSAIVLSVISGEDKMDATSARSDDKDYTNYLTGNVRKKRIGVDREMLTGLSEEIRQSIEEVLEKYKGLGVEIKDIKLPNTKYALPAYYIIMPSEISSNLARYDGVKYGMRAVDHKNAELDFNPEDRNLLENYLDTREYGFGPEVKKRIMLGTYSLSSGYYDAYYLRAQKVRAIIKKEFKEAFSEVDLILMPSTPGVAFKIGEKTEDPIEMYLEDYFTVTANITGVPAISIPAGKIEREGKNLPVGFQLLGKWFDEENLLNAAHAFEIS